MRVVKKPWGTETIWADCERYAAICFGVLPGCE